MSEANNLIEHIKQAEKICICTHVNPDGDTLGSAVALKLFIEEHFEKKVRVFHTSTLPKVYSFLPKYDETEFVSADNNKEIFDLAIAVDIASVDRFAEAMPIYNNAKFRVNIDHHKTNKGYGDLNIVEGDVCAVGLILCKIFNELNYSVSKDMAIALYTSIMTDTGAFKYENTTPECLRAAAQLVEAGASPNGIYRLCYESKPVNMLKFQTHILNKAKFYCSDKISMTSVTKEDMDKFNATDDFTEGIVEVLRTAKSVEISAILKETKDGFTKVSLRSKTVNLLPIIEDFGGGGHIFSAGCTIKKPISIAYDKLLEKLTNAIG
ncbi:bifunctional oligoribonuclease/PAP phosphatase NrnA [bacterium]|nr:bifunctional oligoribonuclease/PAP phosphatase NrnA [bacterium]